MYSIFSRGRRLRLALAIAVLAACNAETVALEASPEMDVVRAPSVSVQSNAAVYWNGVARNMVATLLSSTPFAIRGYAIVSVAQYHAAVAAERDDGRPDRPSVEAAISAASVAVLSYLYPAQAAQLEQQLSEFLLALDRPGRGDGDIASGIEIGRSAGAQVVARAQGDNFFAPWTGTTPTGPGLWFSSTVPPTPPAGAAFGQAKTFLLMSGDQFRPAPPPPFGSPAFAAAVAEVRALSAARTAEQDSLAKFWHLPVGTHAPPGYWNEEGAKLAMKYRMRPREAAHVLALMNIVMYDALIASHEAKYHYWLLRPSQADTAITLSVGLPNFPSYPSNHAAISAGAAQILGRAFPAEARRLHALGEEAALSRVLGGIHYRFDGEAGLELGRRVADWALAHDAQVREPFVLR